MAEHTREGEENGVSGCMSSVIPGWFSEISPMWPGGFLCESLNLFVFLLFLFVYLCLWEGWLVEIVGKGDGGFLNF